jgi:predicted dehydrogenase
MMLNWFVVGHEIPPDHWYLKEEEGGRVLGNLCHWTDFVLCAVEPEERFPVDIHPIRGAADETDIAVAYVFGDDSVAAITFSAKGHTFEGVREQLSAHRGNLLLTLRDFQYLQADIVDRRHRRRLRFRNHGHEESVMRSYALSPRDGGAPGSSVDYVRDTGRLFLATHTALETRTVQRLEIAGRPQAALAD